MGRAHGKHTDRRPHVAVKPGTPEGDYIGLSDRQEGQGSPRLQGEGSPIPGGREHLGNHPTVPQHVPIPESRAEHRGILAHGVPPDSHSTHERAEAERGPNELTPMKPHHAKEPRKAPVPVPVYIVQERTGSRPMKIAVPRHVTVPGFSGDPICIVGKDFNRTMVRLMNPDATNAIRFASDPTALLQDQGTSGATLRTVGGALLPKGMTSYQNVETQDELWAITQHATATVELQIIMESSVPGAGSRL